MKRKWMCMLVCLLALSVGQAAAQRCLPGMQAVEMRGGMAPSAGYFAGLGVTTHAKGGNRWVFGAEYLYRKHDYRTVTLPSAQFTAEGGLLSPTTIRCRENPLLSRGSVRIGRIRNAELVGTDTV